MKKHIFIALVFIFFAILISLLINNWGNMKKIKTNDIPKKLKIGIVFDVSDKSDKSFNSNSNKGIEKAIKEFGNKIEVKLLAPSIGGENREGMLRLLALDEYDLIFAIGFMFTDSIERVAKDFMNIKFVLIDGYVEDLRDEDNLICVSFKEHEGSFLAGIAAALKSKTNKIGFIGGMQHPIIEKFEVGYITGSKHIKPYIQIISDYIGTANSSFNNPSKGKELALKQINSGVDVIFHASGASGSGIFEIAASKKILAIGVDSDQNLDVPEKQKNMILTSVIKHSDNIIYEIIKNLLNQNFKGGNFNLGLAEKGVDYAENEINKPLLSGIKFKLDEVKSKIINGEIKVPYQKKDIILQTKNIIYK